MQPFTSFGDVRDYVLAPFGDFEHSTLDGWSFEGGAGPVVDEDGNRALGLPAGSAATSPAMCIDLNYPTVRFFVRNMLDDDADLKVQVMYVDHEKAYKPHDVKKLKAKGDYGLTKDIKIDPQRGGKEAGWRRVAFRFVAAQGQGQLPRRQPVRRPASSRLAELRPALTRSHRTAPATAKAAGAGTHEGSGDRSSVFGSPCR